MTDLKTRVRETIERYSMISLRDGVLVAVSGGPDSVCMLHVLVELGDEMGFDVKVAHLDHRFRGEESRRDSEFVADLASDLGVPCFCHEENVPLYLMTNAMSQQDAARLLRYQFLVKTSKLEYCQRIATGHNADDQAETVIMRVLRGAGPDGLSGIPPKREGIIIRPLLACWRSEIESYLAEHNLSYRIDASNADPKYLRNEIRSDLLPYLEKYNPQISKSLVTLASIMTDVAAHFDRLTDEAFPEVLKTARVGQFVLDLPKLTGYDEALQRSIFRRAFAALRPDIAPLGARYVDRLLGMVKRADVGMSVEMPGGARARVEHGCIVFSQGEGLPRAIEKSLAVPGSVEFEDAGLTIEAELLERTELRVDPDKTPSDVAIFDWDAISPPIVIRSRREGDRIQPFGMDGTQSVKDLFVNTKIAFSFRASVPLICDTSGILWIAGVRRSSAAQVTQDTKRILVVRARTREVQPGTREDTAV